MVAIAVAGTFVFASIAASEIIGMGGSAALGVGELAGLWAIAQGIQEAAQGN